MLNFGTKTNDTAGAGGQVEDTEYNSLFSEVKKVITKTGIALDGGETDQMIKAIDKISKATEYQDGGTANTIQLTRPATGDTIEELFDGMVVYFSPKFANTGATTIKITTLLAKPAKHLGLDAVADFFTIGYNYKAVYDLSNDWFECEIIANEKYVNDKAIISPTTITGTATFTNGTNTINLVGIGLLGLEIGDVLKVENTTASQNDKLFTLEVPVDDDNIIVNQAHAGGTTYNSLIDEVSTAGVKISLINRAKDAPNGQGQSEVVVTRTLGVPYANTTNRVIEESIYFNGANNTNVSLTIGTVQINNKTNQNGQGAIYKNIGVGMTYTIAGTTISQAVEVR